MKAKVAVLRVTPDTIFQDIDRLVELLKEAAIPPKPRRATRPTLASKQRRVETKVKRGGVKKLR